MQDVMVDIETLGVRPGSVIASIGALQFDPYTGATKNALHWAISVEDCQKNGLTLDASTCKWWMQQGNEARALTFGGTLTLYDTLQSFAAYISSAKPDRIWSKGPQFDMVILESAYRALGMAAPWHYRAPCCMRTVVALANINASEYATGSAHNALDDCRAQVKALSAAYSSLGLKAAQ